ncbi:hypothetical protein F5Y16DRAFT_122034 [Xylariaceae sp. FL0255]|nr:hypothetical protein F5Y16DRAFT_122034 [Xylariaceae sp. FL0255]
MMAGSGRGNEALHQASVRSAASSLGLQNHPQEEDESEWEYEYSTTETETFYVTLDLSKDDFKSKDPTNNPFRSRGGWPVFKGSENLLNRLKHTSSKNNSTDESDDNAEDEGSDADEDQQSQFSDNRSRGRPCSQAGGTQVADEDNIANNNHEKVQILELHSDNPIISYKGRVFEGRWHENLTTELLMTKHDEHSGLPVLRHMEDNVDLLAASCARINVTERELQPKDSQRILLHDHTDTPATVLPPVDPKASFERTNQRNFLANLIALKKRKGETDEVTVVAQTQTRPPRNPLMRGPRTGRRIAAHMIKRLSMTDPDARRRGRISKLGGRGVLKIQATIEREARGGRLRKGRGVSTPTPAHWDELEGASGRDNDDLEGIEEEGDEDENEDEFNQEEDGEEDMDPDENMDYGQTGYPDEEGDETAMSVDEEEDDGHDYDDNDNDEMDED